MKYIAILGLGVVGGGTADLFRENAASIAARVGEDVELKYALDIRDLPDSPYADKIVHDIGIITSDPDVSVVAEVIGGLHPAYEFTCACLKAGKSVVSSNKELVATYGVELLALAKENGVQYLFEASTGGAIPVLAPIARDLAGNAITSISGILNGTTNYILTRMFRAGAGFEAALAEAQEKGYAERNPAADIEGKDACRKICILAATATGVLVNPDSVHTEGITAIRQSDVQAAEKLGYTVKLLGRLVHRGGDFLMVAPFFVPVSCPLSGIEDVFNGILVSCNYAGDIMFYGRGAGAHPTASAVAADIISVLRNDAPVHAWRAPAEGEFPTDFAMFASRHYVAVSGVEKSAVGVAFSGAEVLSVGADGEVTFITSEVTEREFEESLARLSTSGATVQSHIRVYD